MSRRGWVLFVAMCVIWGIPYLLIRVAVRDFSPPALVFARTLPAALLLLPIAAHRGELRAALAKWRWVLLFACVEMVFPWFFLSWSEERLDSSTAGLLIATVPLLAAILYPLISPGSERLDRRRLAGLFVGFAGVAALVGIDVGGTNMTAVAAMAIPALGYTFGPLIISRRLSDAPNLGVVGCSVAVVALVYAPWATSHWPAHIGTEEWAAAITLALVCTALAFVLMFELVNEVGPARSTVITYVNPAVAVLLGVVILNEPFTVGIAVGFPLILLGSVLATRGPVAAVGPVTSGATVPIDTPS
jgi:drug/metabolite transporter (DMT)-like permease